MVDPAHDQQFRDREKAENLAESVGQLPVGVVLNRINLRLRAIMWWMIVTGICVVILTAKACLG
ncbi:MAG: hypothetical protein ACKVZ0_09195 [Gemmatimonadales bacterium]